LVNPTNQIAIGLIGGNQISTFKTKALIGTKQPIRDYERIDRKPCEWKRRRCSKIVKI